MARQAFPPVAIALVILGIVGSGVFIYFQMSKNLPTPQILPSEDTAPEFAEEPTRESPDLDLPELDASDEVIRSLIEQVSDHPKLARWVVNDRLIRRFVAAIENTAQGASPKRHVPFMTPQGSFQAARQGDELVIGDAAFERYDQLTQVFLSLDTAISVRLYRQLEPLFDEAYQDLGYPGGEFENTLQRAIDHLLAAPTPSSDVVVERAISSYKFTDPQYENLSQAQKHFLRMGTDNMQQLRAKLRLMATTLELSEDND